MRDVDALRGLLERVRAATGPDNKLRCDLLLAVGDPDGAGDWMVRLGTVLMKPGAPTDDVTASLNAARALHRLALPDFWISSGLCALSGHASTGPDYNGSAGDRLRETWPEARFREGFHADLKPGDGPHRECYAILDVTLQALIARAEGGRYAE